METDKIKEGTNLQFNSQKELVQYMANKEELTTAMHAEFMEGEISAKDMKIMGVYGAIGAGSSKSDALKKYGISEKEYNENIKRVLKS